MVSRWTIPVTRRNLIPTYAPVYNDLRLSRCASCQRVFTNKDDLRHHILLSHTGRKPHACGICGKRYGQLHHLNSHFKLHREPRLQEFGILKHSHYKPVPKPASPLNTTIGSFKVSKGYKPYAPEETFKSFGTLQSFTITQLDKHKQDNRNQKGGIKLPNRDDSGTAHINIPKRSGDGNESVKRNIDKSFTLSAINGNHTLPDITDRNTCRVRDNGTQTSSNRATNRKNMPLKDFWVDTKSEWRSHNCKNQPESNGTEASFKGHSNSAVSEPVSFKASTPKEQRHCQNMPM